MALKLLAYVRRPHHGSHIVFVFLIIVPILLCKYELFYVKTINGKESFSNVNLF